MQVQLNSKVINKASQTLEISSRFKIIENAKCKGVRGVGAGGGGEGKEGRGGFEGERGGEGSGVWGWGTEILGIWLI